MTKSFRQIVGLLATVLFFSACQKIDWFNHGENGNGNAGHTGRYTSEVAQKWIQMQLRVIQSAPPLPTLNGRYMGYVGTTLYESVVPGMPGFQTLSGQLNGLPALPTTIHGRSYHWPSSANAAMASIIRNLYSTASVAMKAAIDSLENALNTIYQGEVSAETFLRSADFGKSIAQIIFDWSKTDGTYEPRPPYMPPTDPGNWAPTPPGFGPAVQPYLGLHRLFVAGSLAGTDPVPPPAYSTEPSSDFYKMVKDVYDVSQALTPEQTATALYYRDNPGFQGGGGPYLAILYQLLQIENPKLDWAAIAYAKFGIAGADAWVGCWQVKYQYNVMRPIKYIREILLHPDWNPVFGTPPHPDYPSGHSTGGGAAEEVLTGLLGNHYSFTNHAYDYLGMPPQNYSSFADMAMQIGKSRVYAGIHYTLSCEQGRLQGKRIARNIEKKLKFHK